MFRTSIFSYFSMFEGKYLIEKIMESMANHICPNRAQRSLSKYCHFVPIKRCLKVLWTKDTKKLEMHSFHENRPYPFFLYLFSFFSFTFICHMFFLSNDKNAIQKVSQRNQFRLPPCLCRVYKSSSLNVEEAIFLLEC